MEPLFVFFQSQGFLENDFLKLRTPSRIGSNRFLVEHHHSLVAQRRHLFLCALPMRTRGNRHGRIAPLDRRRARQARDLGGVR